MAGPRRLACALAAASLLVALFAGPRAGMAAAQGDGAVDATPPAAAPTPRPLHWEPWSSGVHPALDAYVVHPAGVAARHVQAAWRGALHAVRDVLFPDFRAGGPARARSSGTLDVGFEGEALDDIALREAHRDWWLARADAYGVTALHARKPDVVRYGIAFTIGGALLLALLAVRVASAACARVTFKALLKATGDDMWEDTPGVPDDGSNVFNRIFTGPVEYDFDPRLTPAEAEAMRAAGAGAGQGAKDKKA
jgi:hypothetical protein